MTFRAKRLWMHFFLYFAGLFYLGISFFFFLLSFSESMQNAVFSFLKSNSFFSAILGVFFFVLALFYFLTAKKHARFPIFIQLGKKAVEINETLIRQAISIYLKKHFPACEISYDLDVRKNRLIRIYFEFPASLSNNEKDILKQIETDLSTLIQKQIGWSEDIHILARFKSQ